MSDIEFNQLDFISVLEVIPGQGDTYWAFEVQQHGLTMVLTVFYYEKDIAISLYGDGIDQEILRIDILDVRKVRHVREQNGYECLEIYTPVSELALRCDYRLPIGFRVVVKPQIRIDVLHT